MEAQVPLEIRSPSIMNRCAEKLTSWLRVGILVAIAGNGLCLDCCAQDDPELVLDPEAIRKLLRARDVMDDRLICRFKAQSHQSGQLVSAWDSTWGRAGITEAIRSELLDVTPASGNVRVQVHVTWDHQVRRELTAGTAKGTRYFRRAKGRGTQFRCWFPQEFGFEINGFRIGEYLEVGRLSVLGVETVEGRNCHKLLWDPGAETESESHSPCLIWIDLDETFLIWREIAFVRAIEGRAAPQVPQEVSVSCPKEILAAGFEPFFELKLETADFHDGTWWPTKGNCARLDTVPQTADFSAEWRRAGTDDKELAQLLNITPPPETFVKDEFTETTWYVNPASGESSDAEAMLEECLKRVSARLGLSLSSPPPVPQPVTESTCGANALYCWLRLQGKQASLIQINALVSDGASLPSLKSLEGAAQVQGLELASVRFADPAQANLPETFLAHLHLDRTHTPSERSDDHFVLAFRVGERILFMDPPGGLHEVTLKEFSRYWTGNALVTEAASQQMHLETGQGNLWRITGAILLGIGGATILIAGLRTWRNRWSKGLVPTLILGSSLALLVVAVARRRTVAEIRAPVVRVAKPPSTQQARPGETINFGETDEGVQLERDVVFHNDSGIEVKLATHKSCGCTSVELSAEIVPAGGEAKLHIRVDTKGRGGGLYEYVELRGNGEPLKTYWLVAEIKGRSTVQCIPRLLDIGIIRTGARTTASLEIPNGAAAGGDSSRVRALCDPSIQELGVAVKEFRKSGGHGTPACTAELEFTGLRTGNVDGLLTLEFPAPGGTPLNQVRFRVRARVVSEFYCEQDHVFVGVLSS